MPRMRSSMGSGVFRFPASGAVDPIFAFPLDTWSANNTLAYSFRKLKSTYNGSAVELQLSNGTRQAFGFTPSGNFRRTEADAFNDGTAKIRTWYHQNGGNDLTQTTYANMLLYVSSGPNGLPCARNRSAADTGYGGMFAADSASYKTASVHVFAMLRIGLAQTVPENYYLFGYPRTSSSGIGGSAWELTQPGLPDYLQFDLNASNVNNNNGLDAAHRDALTLYTLKSSDNTIRLNGVAWGLVANVPTTISYPNAVGFYVGMGSNAGNKSLADYFEILIYGADQSAFAAIEANQIAYSKIAEPAASYNKSDGSIWQSIYGGNFASSGGANGGLGPNGQRIEVVNGKSYYTEAAWQPWSIAKSTNVVNGPVYRFEVRTYDRDGGTGTAQERAELDGAVTQTGIPYAVGKTVQIYTKLFVEAGSLVVQGGSDWWYVIQDHYTNATTGASTTFAVGIDSNDHLHVDVAPNNTGATVNDLGVITRGVWNDIFIERFQSAGGTTDTLKFWWNGSLVLNLGPGNLFRTNDGFKDPTYPKVGIYSGNPGQAVTRAVRHGAMQHSDKAVSDISSLIASPPSNPSWP